MHAAQARGTGTRAARLTRAASLTRSASLACSASLSCAASLTYSSSLLPTLSPRSNPHRQAGEARGLEAWGVGEVLHGSHNPLTLNLALTRTRTRTRT
jgi:phosphohistidine phosphatase SixA